MITLMLARIRNSALLLFLTTLSLVFSPGCERPKSVVLDSQPAGAAVTVDGRAIGRTPVELDPTQLGNRITVRFGVPSGSGASSQAAPGSKAERVLKCAYIPLTANLPLFVALDQGYFEANGVKVEAIEATSPNDIMTGIASGKVDFASVMAYPLIFPAAIRFPDAFKLYSSTEETGTEYTSNIIAKKDSPIARIEDLRGKKVGVYTGIVQINFLKAILAGAGISEKDVQIVEISPRLQIQGLVSGQYDALSTTEPTANIARIQGLAKVVAANPRVKYILNPFPSTAATISTRLLKEDPAAAQAVVRALDMAVDFIRTDPEAAKKSLLKYAPVPTDIAPAVLADLKLFRFCKLGEENRLNVQRFADFMYKNGLLNKPIADVNQLFGDYEVLPKE
jgi:NitT/TauT family transport system substrate-binding protein